MEDHVQAEKLAYFESEKLASFESEELQQPEVRLCKAAVELHLQCSPSTEAVTEAEGQEGDTSAANSEMYIDKKTFFIK